MSGLTGYLIEGDSIIPLYMENFLSNSNKHKFEFESILHEMRTTQVRSTMSI